MQVQFLREKFSSLDIEVDGGLSPSTIDTAAQVSVCVCVLQSLLSSLLIPSYSSVLSLLFPVRPFQRFVVHSCHSLQHANNKVVGNTSVGSFLSLFISTYVRTL